MTVGQKHGAIFLGLLLGLMTFPYIALFLTSFFLLFDDTGTVSLPVFKTFLACIVFAWLDWTLWHGHNWVRLLLSCVGLLGGLAMESYGILLVVRLQTGGGEVNPITMLLCLIYGIIYLWGGFQLWRNKNIVEFIKYQQRLTE